MENKLLNEIRRIGNLMGNENILSEQRIIPQILKKIFSDIDDDVARRVMRTTDDTYDDIIRKLRAGETLSDDAVELLLKVIDYDLLAKNLINTDELGDILKPNIEKIINAINENPSKYDELTSKLDDIVEEFGGVNNFPTDLTDAIKKNVRSKIDDGVSSARQYAGSKLAEFGASVLRKLPFVPRNLKTIVTILAEQRKGIQVLKKEIDDLFNNVITDTDSLKNLKRTIEDKLVTIERIADNGAKKTLDEIEAGYKQLKKQGKISKAEYDSFIKDKETITEAKFWNEFIAPNYAELDKQVNGLGSFFRNGIKAFTPVNLDWTVREGRFGWVPKIGVNKEGVRRAFNFLAFNSAQTGADILKRLIKSNAPGKSGANVWLRDTYLRAIGPQLIIPFANAAFWTVWIPSTEWFQQGADWLDIDVDWDIYETTFSELLADLWFDNLLDIWNKDPEKDTQLELGDFRPLFRSRLVEMIISWATNNDYKEPSDTTSTQSGVTTTTNNSELSIPDDLKAVFPDSKLDQIKVGETGGYYWSEPEYKIEKNPTTNEWEVLNPGSGLWYPINKNM